ncbi:MAG: hypothetical protein ACPL09_05035 [Candidatus Methanodesulfokora sp.]
MTSSTERLDYLEKKVQILKNLLLFGEDFLIEKKLVSLRGLGRLLVSEEELEKAIARARRSIFPGRKSAIRD